MTNLQTGTVAGSARSGDSLQPAGGLPVDDAHWRDYCQRHRHVLIAALRFEGVHSRKSGEIVAVIDRLDEDARAAGQDAGWCLHGLTELATRLGLQRARLINLLKIAEAHGLLEQQVIPGQLQAMRRRPNWNGIGLRVQAAIAEGKLERELPFADGASQTGSTFERVPKSNRFDTGSEPVSRTGSIPVLTVGGKWGVARAESLSAQLMNHDHEFYKEVSKTHEHDMSHEGEPVQKSNRFDTGPEPVRKRHQLQFFFCRLETRADERHEVIITKLAEIRGLLLASPASPPPTPFDVAPLPSPLAPRESYWGRPTPLAKADLLDPASIEELYRHAVARGRFLDNELDRLRFEALCLFVARVGSNPGALLTKCVFAGATVDYRAGIPEEKEAADRILERARLAAPTPPTAATLGQALGNAGNVLKPTPFSADRKRELFEKFGDRS